MEYQNISKNEQIVLAKISKGISRKELLRQLDLNPTSIQFALEKLKEKELIETEKKREVGNPVFIKITDKGKKLIAGIN